MELNLILLVALGAFAAGSADRPMTQNTGPISPGVDYPMPQIAGPISPGVDYPRPQNTGPISPGVDYPMIENTGPFFQGVDYPIPTNTGPISPGVDYPAPKNLGADFLIPRNQGPVLNSPVYNGPVYKGPVSNGPRCGVNEVYQRCGVGWQCENYCGRGVNACAYCEDGCYCKPGYIRSGPEYTAQCIPKRNCPRAREVIVVEKTVRMKCKINEEFNSCGGCDQYCNREPFFCTLACDRPGCYCRKGYVRSFEGGNCIRPNTCPKVQNDAPKSFPIARPQCSKNEVYQTCGVGWQCEDYCGRGTDACAAYCEDGCYCKQGYIRSGPEYTAKCIPENQCPRALNVGSPMSQSAGPGPVKIPYKTQNSGPRQCKMNEVYNSCNGCDQFCGSEPIACKQDCSSPGCYCASGFVRTSKGGSCIRKDDCNRPEYQNVGYKKHFGPGPVKIPSKTEIPGQKLICDKPNEQYACGSACQTTCKNLGKICPIQNIRCNDACYCKEGYARAENGTCIAQDQC